MVLQQVVLLPLGLLLLLLVMVTLAAARRRQTLSWRWTMMTTNQQVRGGGQGCEMSFCLVCVLWGQNLQSE
jgi:hypothetical protein